MIFTELSCRQPLFWVGCCSCRIHELVALLLQLRILEVRQADYPTLFIVGRVISSNCIPGILFPKIKELQVFGNGFLVLMC